MADNKVRKVAELTIGTDKFVSALQSAATALSDFQGKLGKQLSIKIDDKSLFAMRTAFSQTLLQMEHGLGVTLSKAFDKGAQEIVASMKEVGTKVEALAVQATAAITTSMVTGTAEGTARMEGIIDAMLKNGIAQHAAAQKQIGAARLAKDAETEAVAKVRFEDSLANRIAAAKQSYNRLASEEKAALDRIMEARNLSIGREQFTAIDEKDKPYLSPTGAGEFDRAIQDSKDEVKKEVAVQTQWTAAVKKAVTDRIQALTEEKKERKKLASMDRAQTFDNMVDVRIQKWKRMYAQLTDIERAAFDKIAADANISLSRAQFVVPNRSQTGNTVDRTKIADVNNAFAQAKSYGEEQNALLSQQLESHKGIATSIAGSIVNMARWLVLYRLVGEVARAIQTTLQDFVSNGFAYAKAQETQQLALRGILAENFTITDQQGKQLTGATALSVLQGESARQWQQIQAASFSVVGTTEDLMGLYESILPFAAKLGKGLEDVQRMTKATAVAASLLNVSFNDARSAVIGLLQGRALSRNRLVGMLGISAVDIKNLKDTPELFDKIESKLDQFLALAPQAQMTFAAMVETLQDFAGKVGSAFVGPLMDGFKKFVTFLQNNLFELDKAKNLVPTKEFESFLATITHGVTQAIAPFKAFGAELLRQAANDLPLWINGILKIVTPIGYLAVELTKITLAVLRFVAVNTTFITSLVGAVAAFVGWSALKTLLGYLNDAATATSGLGRLFGLFLTPAVTTATAATATMGNVMAGAAVKQTFLATSISTLSQAFKLLAGATVLGAVVAAIGVMVFKLMQFWDQANRVKALADALKQGRSLDALGEADKQFQSDDKAEQEKGARGYVDAAASARQALFKANQGTTSQIYDINAKIDEENRGFQKQYDEIGKNETAALIKGKELTEVQKAANAAVHDTANEKRKAVNEAQAAQKIEIDNFAERLQTMSTITARAANVERAVTMAHADVQKLEKELSDLQKHPDQMRAGTSRGGGLLEKELKEAKDHEAVMNAAAQSLRAEQLRVESLKSASDQHRVNLTPNEADKADAKIAKPEWNDTYDILVKQFKQQQELQESRDKLEVASMQDQDKGQEWLLQRNEARADELSAYETKQYQVRLELLDKYEAAARAYDKQVKPGGNQITDEELAKKRLDIDADEANQIAASERRRNEEKAHWLDRERAFTSFLDQYGNTLDAKEAELTGRVGDKAAAEWQKQIDKLQNATGYQSPEQDARRKQLIEDMQKQLPGIYSKAADESTISQTTRTMGLLENETRLLNKQFDAGAVSVKDYVSETLRLNAAEKESLEIKKAALQSRLRALTNNDIPDELRNYDQISRLEAELNGLDDQIDSINNKGALTRKVFESWTGAFEKLDKLVSVFDNINTDKDPFENWRTSLISVLHIVDDTISRMGQMQEVIKQFKDAFAASQIQQAVMGGGLGSRLSSMFLGTRGGSTIPTPAAGFGVLQDNGFVGPQEAGAQGVDVSGINDAFDSVAVKAQDAGSAFSDMAPAIDGASKNLVLMGQMMLAANTTQSVGQAAAGAATSAAPGVATATRSALSSPTLAAVTFGASAAIAVGMALYAHAVKSATESIQKSFQSLQDSIKQNSTGTGRQLELLELERKKAVYNYSQSKAGKKALETVLPDIDKMIEQVKDKIKAVQDAFKLRLEDAQAGSGAFADFRKTLLDLEAAAKEYIEAAGTDEAAVQKAKADVRELLNLTLKKAKEDFTAQELDLQSGAIQDAEKVLDLLDQSQQLADQAQDLRDQRADVEDQRDADVIARQKQINDFEKERLQRIADIKQAEQDISDIQRKARDDEAAVRQKGVLEGSTTIAQQKARDISNIRYDAQKQLTDAQKKLADLKDWSDYYDRVQQAEKDSTKRTKDFDKQLKSLDKQTVELQKQRDLNDVQLAGAIHIRDLDLEMTSLASDRVGLEQQKNVIESAQAVIRLAHWKEIKGIIDSIAQDADGNFTFIPPEGFPKINVTIGGINIYNTTNNPPPDAPPVVDTPSPGVPAGPGNQGDNNRGPGGGRDENGNDQDPSQPYGFRANSDYTRQFGDTP